MAVTASRSIDDVIAQYRPIVLVFLPNTNELQRFVISGAFDDLARSFQLRFVFTPKDAAKMYAAAPSLLRPDNSYEFDIPDERYRDWCEIFDLSCRLYADRSVSFALRIGATPDGQSDFDLQLLRNAWRVVRRLRPFLLGIPWLRTRWGAASSARREKIDQIMSSKASLAEWMESDTRVRNRAQLEEKLAEVRPYEPLVALLDSINPLFCVLPTSLLDTYCNDLLLAASETQHSVLALQSGWDNLSSKGMIHHQPLYMGVWGPQSAKHASKIQGVGSTVVLGSPHYEALVRASDEERERFRAQLGVSPDQRLILFGGSFRQFDETAALKRLERAIEAKKFGAGQIKILYRPHPWRKDRLHEDNFFDHDWKHTVFDPDMQDRYVRSKAERGFLRAAPMFDMSYLALVLSSVDAVISPMSTLLIESLIIDKPTMAVAFGDDKHTYSPGVSAHMTHFRELRKSRAVEWCANEANFEESCRKLISRCGQGNDPEPRRLALEQIVHRSDVPYSRRLDEFARITLEPLARNRRAKRVSRLRVSHSHSYDAHLILKEYCNLPRPMNVPGNWMHGWIPASFNVHLALVATHKKAGITGEEGWRTLIEAEKLTVPQWVARADQEAYLGSQGYKHVRAIGLPFAYLPPVKSERVPGSLLVMPPHSHDSHGPGDAIAEGFADSIASKRKEFSEIWVCLNSYDYQRGDWVEAFRKRDIPVIIGAEQGDPRTLYRLKHLLSSFEFVTTNGFGSHMAFAAACGAKLSVFGPFADHPREPMVDCWAAKVDANLIDVLCDLHSEASCRKHYPFLFGEPEKAVRHEEWGRKEIGDDVRLAPEALMDLFSWRELATADAN